jgi:hypothetical protein
VEDRAGETNTGGVNSMKADPSAALAMLDAFASVGATAFDVSLTDIEEAPKRFEPKRSLDELRRTIAKRLETASRARLNVIIRPRSATALLVQLDDLDDAKAERMETYAFMTVRTSPRNCQVWLAVSDGPKETEKEAARLFRTRVRRGAGADKTATGATRIAGSLNIKHKYAPAFPVVTLGQVNAGRVTTTAALDQAGLIAAPEPQPPASVPRPSLPPQPGIARKWPDYQQALRGAPLKRDGSGPDRSLADFMFCKWAAERGWSIEATAEKLAEVSAKAQERIRLKEDKGYTLLTARNAAAAVERERDRRTLRAATPAHQKHSR